MTIALAPPICGDDVPVGLINKTLQKLMPIFVDKSILFFSIFSIINKCKSKVSIIKDISVYI